MSTSNCIALIVRRVIVACGCTTSRTRGDGLTALAGRSLALLRVKSYSRKRASDLPASAVRPSPLVSGEDLIQAGYPPGPLFKEILAAVEDAQLDGQLHSKEQALQFVQAEFPRNPAAS